MADLAFYQRALGLSTVDAICDAICASVIKTNRGPSFWVDWNKVTRRSDAYRRQLALLSTLRGSEDPSSALASLLSDYPEVAQAFPRLLAEQRSRIAVLIEAESPFECLDLDFAKPDFDGGEIDALVAFADQTGLLALLSTISCPPDYLLGVEVGLDSNARKNRSGVFLERLVGMTLDALTAEYRNLRVLTQTRLTTAAHAFEVQFPPLMADSRADFCVLWKGIPTDIEVNFYGGSGSKPSEIVNAYSDRSHALTNYGWRLVWVTDGPGWLKMRNPLRKGVTDIDYVLTLKMVQDGLLSTILLNL